MITIQRDALGLWASDESRNILRPMGKTRFVEGERIDSHYLSDPARYLRGLRASNRDLNEFAEIWGCAGSVARSLSEREKEEEYCFRLGRFYDEFPAFDSEASSQNIQELTRNSHLGTVARIFKQTSNQIVARGRVRMEALLLELSIEEGAAAEPPKAKRRVGL